MAKPASFADWPLGQGAVTARKALQATLLFTLHKAFCRPFRVIGAQALLSEKGPLLIIANHSSHADTVSILRALPQHLRQRTTAAAAADYFYAGAVRGALASLVLNTFPFSRAGQVRASLERCGRLCDDGWSILIYPEGTRSVDGHLLPFKSGIGLLATGLGIPVLPVAVSGGHDVLPKGATWPRRAPVTVQFGSPLVIPNGMSPEVATAMLQQAVAALMDHPDRSVEHAR